ncbi:hypothetical protein BGX27_010819 [Mortierella sp. AM989]|nr:hypothetical protein BGX27_010819 [Mortierella sp. AM989]
MPSSPTLAPASPFSNSAVVAAATTPSITTTSSVSSPNVSNSILSGRIPRLLVAGLLWITLVITAAHLFLLSHVGFIVLNCFSHLTATSSSSTSSSSSSTRRHTRLTERDDSSNFTDDYAVSASSTSFSPFRNNVNTNNSSRSILHRHAPQSNSQASSQAANPGGTSRKVISKEEWNTRLAEVHVDREDLNKLIMNYLIIEGYKDAAEKFRQESGAKPPVNLESIQDRMIVRTAIQRGNIEEAIERVNDLNPEILDTNPKLFFHLQQQRLIEYIREGRIMEALEFAQEELAPRGEENPEFLSELERTMSLLAFELNGPSPVSDLLTPAQRQKLASELNSALLLSQSQEKDPKLPALLKMCWFAQQQLDERCTFPKIKDFNKAELVMEPMGNGPIGGGAGTSGSSGAVAGA